MHLINSFFVVTNKTHTYYLHTQHAHIKQNTWRTAGTAAAARAEMRRFLPTCTLRHITGTLLQTHTHTHTHKCKHTHLVCSRHRSSKGRDAAFSAHSHFKAHHRHPFTNSHTHTQTHKCKHTHLVRSRHSSSSNGRDAALSAHLHLEAHHRHPFTNSHTHTQTHKMQTHTPGAQQAQQQQGQRCGAFCPLAP